MELSRRNLTPLQLSSIVSTVFWSFVLHLFHFPFLEYSGSESGADEVINIVLGIHPPTKHQQLRLSSKPHVPSSPRIILVLASRDVTMARYAALQQLACRHMPRPGALQPHYHHSKHIPTSQPLTPTPTTVSCLLDTVKSWRWSGCLPFFLGTIYQPTQADQCT